MLAQVHSFVLHGIEPGDCEVELDVADADFPAKPVVVGLPDAAVKESIERVQAAVTNSGYPMPAGKITVNLAPADVQKTGPRYDLPIAVAMLLAQRVLPPDAHRPLRFAGELALDGRIRPISGVINLALLAKRMGATGVVVPSANAAEASAVHGIDVFPADSLAAVIAHLNQEHPIEPVPPARFDPADQPPDPNLPDFADIRGQEGAKRALMVAAAGNHNALMIGPPGSGKTLMARAMPSILPPLSRQEALEVTRVYSAVGKVPVDTPLIHTRPVRAPHHTASSVAIIGGGTHPRPGEASLAHHGVLFLDEMPEFPRTVLETLRQPLEDHHVTIARAQGVVTFPARFMLLAAMNPTPKGYKSAGAAGQRAMDQYLAKLSGPLLDRVDLHIDVPPVPHDRLMSATPGISSANIRQQVLAARTIQHQRNGGPLHPNANLSHAQLDRLAPLDPAAADLLKRAMADLGLSARAYDKVRRVALTLADLQPDANAQPKPLALEHVAEAIQYRQLDRRT